MRMQRLHNPRAPFSAVGVCRRGAFDAAGRWLFLDHRIAGGLYARLPRGERSPRVVVPLPVAAPSDPRPRFRTMSRRCELPGVGPMTGHNVSHSNIKTKRRFLPSLAQVVVPSDSLGQTFKLKITNAALRTLDFRGGLDNVLMNSKDEVLSPKALKIKRQVKAKLAATQPAA